MQQCVVITGGGDSVGRVMAEKFLAQGDQVHICDVNGDALAATLAANPGMTGTAGSVGSPDDVKRIFAEAFAAMERVDVLVNAVGVAGPHGPIETLDNAAWEQTIAVNLNGMFYCMKEVLPGMKARRHGVIINFSSGSTRTGLPNRTPYVASKYAVEGLTHTAARELGPHNIRCNAILPGAINNQRMQMVIERNAAAQGLMPAELKERLLRYISMRTMIEPEELADTVLFLASDKARHITGQMIEVSGLVEWEE